jgi:hypothetical protein
MLAFIPGYTVVEFQSEGFLLNFREEISIPQNNTSGSLPFWESKSWAH